MRDGTRNLQGEWVYEGLKPRIIAEELLRDVEDGDLKDYKFFCFNGKVRFFKVDFGRYTEHHANYYDRSGMLQPFGEWVCPPVPTCNVVLPSNLTKMIELAETLSEGMAFLRVDLYNVQSKIYFGECTFYPNSGFGPFEPVEWDLRIGEFLDLSDVGNHLQDNELCKKCKG